MDAVLKKEGTSEGLNEDDYNDMNLLLISWVKKHPYLYDKRDRRHTDRTVVDRAWDRVGKETGLQPEEAKMKWMRLRNNYAKAQARRDDKRPNGSYSNSGLKLKPWIYQPEMEFLKEHLTRYPKRGSQPRPAGRARPRGQPAIAFGSGNSLDAESNMSEDEEGNDSDFTEYEVQLASSAGSNLHVLPAVASASAMEVEATHNRRGKLSEEEEDFEDDRASKCSDAPDDRALHVRSPALVANRKRGHTKANQQRRLPVAMQQEMDYSSPLVSWFKGFVPVLGTLSTIRLLDFQTRVTQEVKRVVLEQNEEERGTKKETRSKETSHQSSPEQCLN